MAQDYADLFGISQRKNYVENDPDLENAQTLKMLSENNAVPPMSSGKPTVDATPEWKPKKLVGNPTEMLKENLNTPPQVGEQTKTPQDEINQTPIGETYKPVQETNLPPMDVSGRFKVTDPEEKKDKMELAKAAVDEGSSADIWGRLIVGLTPYALEGLFGGGKWMGSAGKGSAEGIKMYEGLDKDRRNEEMKKSQFQAKLDASQKAADAKIALEQEKMRNPNYTAVKETKDPITGKNLYSAMNAKTGDWKTSDLEAPPKEPNLRDQNSAEYLKLAKERYSHQKEMDALGQKQKYQKEVNEGMQGLSAADAYINKYRDLKSFDTNYSKVPDTQLPEELKAERQGIRRLVYGYVVENAGKAQTESEVRNALTSVGMNVTPKTIQEVMTDPTGWTDRYVSSVDRNTLRGNLDSITRVIQAKQKAREAAFPPEAVAPINTATGIHAHSIPVYKETSSNVSAEEKLKAAKKRLGL